jgi:hypothetical protein
MLALGLCAAGLRIAVPRAGACCATEACCCAAVLPGCCSEEEGAPAEGGPRVVSACSCGHGQVLLHGSLEPLTLSRCSAPRARPARFVGRLPDEPSARPQSVVLERVPPVPRSQFAIV